MLDYKMRYTDESKIRMQAVRDRDLKWFQDKFKTSFPRPFFQLLSEISFLFHEYIAGVGWTELEGGSRKIENGK